MAQRGLGRLQGATTAGGHLPRKQPSLPNLGGTPSSPYGKLHERSSTSSSSLGLVEKWKRSGLVASTLGEPEYPITRDGDENRDFRLAIGEFIQVPTRYNMGGIAGGSLASSFTISSDREHKPHTILVIRSYYSLEEVDGEYEPFYFIYGFFVRSFSGKNSGVDGDPAGFEKHKQMCLLKVESQRVLVPSIYQPPTATPSFTPPLECTYVAEKAAWINISCENLIRIPKGKFVSIHSPLPQARTVSNKFIGQIKRFKPPGLVARAELGRLLNYRSSLPGMEKERKKALGK